jgi:hypothetical protein
MRVLTLVTIAMVVAAAAATQAAPAPNPAPVFELQLFNGQTFRLADQRGKNAVLLLFWAPW